MARGEDEIHVVMLPWLAFGHMTPFLLLSIALAKFKIHVTFISTPRNIQRLPKVPSTLSPFIDFVSFPLPKLEPGLLPDNAEATVDVPEDKIQYLKMAYDLLQEPFKNFIEEKLPNWIILDIIPYWASQIARDLNIPVIAFGLMNAAAGVFFGPPEKLAGKGQSRLTPESLTVSPEWNDIESKVSCKKFEANNLHELMYGKNKSGITDAERTAIVFESARAMAIRSFPEFEADDLNTLGKIMKKPAIPVGLLPPEHSKDQNMEIKEDPWISIFQWLDKQKPRSVVYVGFGSETKFTKEEIDELAYGIEHSGLPFFWVLRKPDWASTDHSNLDVILPTGFGSRTTGRGIVHIGWAPQWEILSHTCVGGTLYHVGWSSTIEALQYGHSLVLLPIVVDQPLNARMLVEKGLGIEVERDDLDGKFSRKDIEVALRKVMVSEEGENVRIRAREAALLFGDGKLNEKYVRIFAEYLKKNGDKQHEDKGEN